VYESNIAKKSRVGFGESSVSQAGPAFYTTIIRWTDRNFGNNKNTRVVRIRNTVFSRRPYFIATDDFPDRLHTRLRAVSRPPPNDDETSFRTVGRPGRTSFTAPVSKSASTLPPTPAITQTRRNNAKHRAVIRQTRFRIVIILNVLSHPPKKNPDAILDAYRYVCKL